MEGGDVGALLEPQSKEAADRINSSIGVVVLHGICPKV